eukprot:2086440-Pleurochrysis_carterae.AAC.2
MLARSARITTRQERIAAGRAQRRGCIHSREDEPLSPNTIDVCSEPLVLCTVTHQHVSRQIISDDEQNVRQSICCRHTALQCGSQTADSAKLLRTMHAHCWPFRTDVNRTTTSGTALLLDAAAAAAAASAADAAAAPLRCCRAAAATASRSYSSIDIGCRYGTRSYMYPFTHAQIKMIIYQQ